MEQIGFEFDDPFIFLPTVCEGSHDELCGKNALIFFVCNNCGPHAFCHDCIWGDKHIDHECTDACCARGHTNLVRPEDIFVH